jgi:hypothetical protein
MEIDGDGGGGGDAKVKKNHEARSMCRVSQLNLVVRILLIENRQRKREIRKNEANIIVVMASRRRAVKELGRVTFSPDTTSGGGSPRASLRGLPKREERIFLESFI